MEKPYSEYTKPTTCPHVALSFPFLPGFTPLPAATFMLASKYGNKYLFLFSLVHLKNIHLFKRVKPS
jgi:hypothetical protein